MAAYNKFEIFVEDLCNKVHDLFGTGGAADTISIYASNATPDAALDTIKTELAEITAQNGYPAGGSSITLNGTRSAGTYTMGASDVIWTGTPGGFGPLRYIVLYNDSTAAKVDPLIGWWDYLSSVSPGDGETFTTDFTTGAFTLA